MGGCLKPTSTDCGRLSKNNVNILWEVDKKTTVDRLWEVVKTNSTVCGRLSKTNFNSCVGGFQRATSTDCGTFLKTNVNRLWEAVIINVDRLWEVVKNQHWQIVRGCLKPTSTDCGRLSNTNVDRLWEVLKNQRRQKPFFPPVESLIWSPFFYPLAMYSSIFFPYGKLF